MRIEAKHEKARRGDELPLPSDLVELLKPWLATLGPDELLWPGKWAAQNQGSKFIQNDLTNARKRWLGDAQDAAERGTRRTFCRIATRKAGKPISMRYVTPI